MKSKNTQNFHTKIGNLGKLKAHEMLTKQFIMKEN